MFGCDAAIVFEILGIFANDGHFFGCFWVIVLHHGFKISLVSLGIVVGLDKAIDKIDSTGGILNPGDGERIKLAQIAGSQVADKQIDGFLLLVIFGKRLCFLQVFHHFLKRFAVHAVGFCSPDLFHHFVVGPNQF